MDPHIQEQLDEIELLQSMYSSPGEFQLEDQISYDQGQAYCQQLCSGPPATLSFKLCLLIDAHQDSDYEAADSAACIANDNGIQHRVEVLFRLNNSYPDSLPDVHLSSNDLHRTHQDNLNSDLKLYMDTLTLGEPCLLTILEWVKDNAGGYFPIPMSHSNTVEPESDKSSDKCFCRMWLYMHHIYSKTKRRNILAYASDLELTGFCLPGKPGVVCVEGTQQNVKEFYSILRRWNWKSITCRKRELSESHDLVSCRQIEGFRELVLDMHGHRSNHMDMGQFLEFLKDHKLEYMFKELFGVEGQGLT